MGDTIERYRRDGVVHIPGLLDASTIARFTAAYDAGMRQPSAAAMYLYPETGTFFQDLANTPMWPAWVEALRASPVPELLATLWGCDDVWFYYEQVFLKEGGPTRRTPWHQDSSYLAVTGGQVANVWVPLDPVSAEDALEFVPGSHRGVLYGPSAFSPEDDTAPLDPSSPLPRLPDIEAHRERWDIVSWACQPGDAIVFDIGLLHGGAATRPGGRRRTVALRCFGPDARNDPRPGSAGAADEAPDIVRFHNELAPGEALSAHTAFPSLRGRT